MEETTLIDLFRELEKNILNTFKVASLGIVTAIQNEGYQVELIPKLNNQTITVNALGIINNIVYNNSENKNEYKNIINIGDKVLVIFLDNITKSYNANINISDSLSKHTYSNAVIAQVYGKVEE